MRAEPPELMIEGFRVFNEEGPSAYLDYLARMDAMDPDFVMEFQADAPNGGEWHGEEGFKEVVRIWLEAWEEFEIKPGEPVELAEGRWLLPTRQRVIARGSGMELEDDFFYTFQIEEGRFKRIGLFTERSLAERQLGVGGEGG